jgi:hypothetical protein
LIIWSGQSFQFDYCATPLKKSEESSQYTRFYATLHEVGVHMRIKYLSISLVSPGDAPGDEEPEADETMAID